MAVEPIPANILQLADAREEARKRGGKPPENYDDRMPVVRIVPGELPRIIDEAEAALLASSGHGLYCFGNNIVHIDWEDIRISGGGSERSLRHLVMNVAGLVERFAKAARFEKWFKTESNWGRCDCPKQVAESYLARGSWRLPPLLGVVTAPTMRPDGSLISTPGYDSATGLVFDPLGVDFGEINEQPARKDAERGLERLKELIQHFGFATEADRSVALSGIITAVVRQAMATAPMHAFDAPVAGSGKSLLVDLAAIVATGHRAAVMSTGSDKYGDNEFEKRLSSAVLGGDPIVSMDNMNEPLDGQLLCQLLTQHSVKIRPFGKLQNVTIPSIATFFGNGNNLVVLGDLTRRVLVGRIDPKVERPELVKYPFDPVKVVLADRPGFIRAVLAIVMAHQQSGDNGSDPLGSFGEWSYLVRDALIWLGEADPMDVMERTRAADPRLETLRAVVVAWRTTFGSAEVRVKDIVPMITEIDPSAPDLREAMLSFAGFGRGGISPVKIAWWLRQNLERTIAIGEVKYRFLNTPDTNGARWRLEYKGLGGESIVDEPITEMENDVPF